MVQRDPSSGTRPLILTVLSGSWFQAWMKQGRRQRGGRGGDRRPNNLRGKN